MQPQEGQPRNDGLKETPEDVVTAIVTTMQGIAQEKNIKITPNQLRTAAVLVAMGAEKAGDPIVLEEAVSPHTELMTQIKKAVEFRASQ